MNFMGGTVATFLLTWNPKTRPWKDELAEKQMSLRSDGTSSGFWSCRSNQVSPGGHFFLMRQGVKPTGIIASGLITSRNKERPHWRKRGKMRGTADIRFAELINPESEGILRSDNLYDLRPQTFWSARSSGIQIPDEVLTELEQRWGEVTTAVNAGDFSFAGPSIGKKDRRLKASIPEGINAKHIKSALTDLRAKPNHGYGKPTGYFLIDQGDRFAPKAVIGHAHQYAFGEILPAGQFRSGEGATEAVGYLRRLGFSVVHFDNGQAVLRDTCVIAGVGDSVELIGKVNTEGRKQLIAHFRRERRAEITRAKKLDVLACSGKLACEVCDFDFVATYGELGEGFAECHHRTPLSDGARETKLKDLAIICPNCHRMIHRRTIPVSIDELRSVLEERRRKFPHR